MDTKQLEEWAAMLYWSNLDKEKLWAEADPAEKELYLSRAEAAFKMFAEDERMLDRVFKKVVFSENASDDPLDLAEAPATEA